MVCLRLYSLLGIAGYAGLNGGLLAMGGAGEELLSATPFGAAGRRPNRGCWPLAAAGAARNNVTKPHRQRTYRDAGLERLRERRAGARAKPEQVPQGDPGRGLGRRRGPHVDRRSKYKLGGTNHADVGHARANRFTLNSDRRSSVRILIKHSLPVR